MCYIWERDGQREREKEKEGKKERPTEFQPIHFQAFLYINTYFMLLKPFGIVFRSQIVLFGWQFGVCVPVYFFFISSRSFSFSVVVVTVVVAWPAPATIIGYVVSNRTFCVLCCYFSSSSSSSCGLNTFIFLLRLFFTLTIKICIFRYRLSFWERETKKNVCFIQHSHTHNNHLNIVCFYDHEFSPVHLLFLFVFVFPHNFGESIQIN